MSVGGRPQSGALAAAGFMIALLAPQAGLSQSGPVERSLALVNEAREAQGLAPLSAEPELVAAAEAHAEDMLERDYYDHVSPEGGTVRDRYLAAGGGEGRFTAENIALCEGCRTPPGPDQVESFHEGWMDSPEHRDAILDRGIESFGFAMTADDERVFGVQTFAGPGRPPGLGPDETEEALPPEALREEALERINAARAAAELPPLARSEHLDRLAGEMTRDGRIEEPERELSAALPAEVPRGLAAVAFVSATCGGCGEEPTAADVQSFLDRWLEDATFGETLLDPAASRLGYALTADGEGRKAAVALLGMDR